MDGLTVLAEQRGEATTLQTLLKNAKSGAIPDQDLATAASTVAEQEQIAAQWITIEALFNETVQPVVALAQIDGCWMSVAL